MTNPFSFSNMTRIRENQQQTKCTMKSLFIGHIYLDITFITDTIPTGDNKVVADSYSYGIGGNAVVAAFTYAKLGLAADLLVPMPADSMGEVLSLKCKN